MDADIALVAGIFILAFALPALISALTDSRTPRVAALCFMIGGTFVVYAVNKNPGGYAFADVPKVFQKVVLSYVE